MSNDRGVFTLSAYRRAQVEGQGVDLDDVWTTDLLDDAGYFAGGESGVPDVSRIDKIAYSTDTKSTLTSNISVPVRGMGSSSSPTAGYTMGGYNSSTTSRSSKIDKLTYATQTTSLIPGNFSDTSTYASAGGGSTTAGYLLQGMSPMVSYIRKITYATETIELLPSRVPNPVGNNAKMGSTGNGNTFLYVIGGSDGSGSEAKKLTYASDSVSNIPNMPTPGSLNRAQKAGCASSTEAAYIVGGSNPYNNRIDKITFSNDTCSYASMNSTVPTPAGRMQVAGTGLPSAGYFAGGTETSIVEKITYSTNSIARIPALDLTSGVSGAAGFGAKGDNHESPVATRWKDGFKEDDLKVGYYQGGGNPSSNSATQKVSFVTDEASLVPGGSLPQNGSMFAGVNSNSTKAILSGGEPGGEAFMKFVYTTETSSNLAGSMPSRRNYNNDMGYGTESVGYVTGGGSEPSNPGFYYSSTQKVEYATDTTSDVPGANAHQPLAWMAAFGNVDHTTGYITGGLIKSPTAAVSRIQKMTYSTETIANTPANMHNNYFNLGTSSGPDSAYLYSQQEYPGYTAGGNIQKFVYATDSRTTIPQSNYYPTYGANGTGNSTNGYYGGGYSPSSPGHRFTRILKLSFSTGLGQDLPSSQFANPGVYRSAASSAVARKKSPKGAPVPTPTSSTSPVDGLAPNFGVAGGGDIIPGGVYTLFDKLEYSTETNSVLPSSDATSGTGSYSQRSITSQTEGWSNSAAGTHLWKFVYSTSTQNPSPASHTIRNFANGFAISNKTEGYFGGGANVGTPGPSYSGGPSLSIDKFTFSTSTASQVPDGTGTPSSGNYSFNTSNVGHQEVGYYAGGNSDGMGKYVYATNTQSTIANKLTSVNQKGMGAGNATYGYFIAGDRSSTDRITYSTDTVTKLPGASYPPGDQTTGGASHSSSDAGYTQSGRSPSAPHPTYHWTNTRKITYSTSTISELPASADVSVGRNDYSGFSARQNNNGSAAPSPNLV